MPTFPNTSGIATAIKNIMLGAQVNGVSAYANVIVGGLKDYTDALPVGSILMVKGSSDRYTLGRSAKIHDILDFNIASVVSYTNAEQAEQQLYGIRDEVTFLFEQSATLNTPGVILSKIAPNSERWSFPTINGSRCRVHEFLLEVKFEYTLPLGPLP